MTCNLKTHTGTAGTVDARHHSDAGPDLYAIKMICWTYGYREIEIEKAREGRFLPTRIELGVWRASIYSKCGMFMAICLR